MASKKKTSKTVPPGRGIDRQLQSDEAIITGVELFWHLSEPSGYLHVTLPSERHDNIVTARVLMTPAEVNQVLNTSAMNQVQNRLASLGLLDRAIADTEIPTP